MAKCMELPSLITRTTYDIPPPGTRRDYGLLAANPFGLHYFQKQEAGAGDYTIKKGDTLVLRYRLVVHRGDERQAGIEELYEQFADK